MGVVEVLDPVQPTRPSGWKVDVSRGEPMPGERIKRAGVVGEW